MAVFRDSSEVEQLTVNQLVVGSIPTRGATLEEENEYCGCYSFRL